MNRKNTRILLVLVVGLFAYIYFFERHLPDTQTGREKASKMFPDFDGQPVERVQIVIRTNQVISVERTNELWSMTQPVRYAVEPTAIENFLKALASLTRESSVSA